ncbi:transposase [Fluviibacterium sp. DFM31]|uniref:Transposase n=1 Tax=Meridianimarinicoccus marinus TaxID=3231483 RepID=A0ABV3LAF4_9RHOB
MSASEAEGRPVRTCPETPETALAGKRTYHVVAAFGDWLRDQRLRVSTRSRPGERLAYLHRHWDGLQTFLAGGRDKIDSIPEENLIRPIAPNRKNTLFAGQDEGRRTWECIVSLIETAEINFIEPFSYLKATLLVVAGEHPQGRIDELLPWIFKPSS